jgi:hypothetical protein
MYRVVGRKTHNEGTKISKRGKNGSTFMLLLPQYYKEGAFAVLLEGNIQLCIQRVP